MSHSIEIRTLGWELQLEPDPALRAGQVSTFHPSQR